MKDQKHRNAYKRFWRNMRNYQRTIDQMGELNKAADRQLDNAFKALNEMEMAR